MDTTKQVEQNKCLTYLESHARLALGFTKSFTILLSDAKSQIGIIDCHPNGQTPRDQNVLDIQYPCDFLLSCVGMEPASATIEKSSGNVHVKWIHPTEFERLQAIAATA